jgi:hypothetical protein
MIVQDGACMVLFRRFWDRSLSAGHPISAPESARQVTLAGRQVALNTYAQFEGYGKVQALWIEGESYDVKYVVRIIFQHCPDAVCE